MLGAVAYDSQTASTLQSPLSKSAQVVSTTTNAVAALDSADIFDQQATEKASSPIAHDYTELMQMASSLLSGCVSTSSTGVPNALAGPNAAHPANIGHTTTQQRLAQNASFSVKEEAAVNSGAISNFNGHKNKAVQEMPQNSELRNDVKLSNMFSPNTLQLPLSANKKFVRNSLIGTELNFSPVNMHQPADPCKSMRFCG